MYEQLYSKCTKFAQQADTELSSPQIRVEPADTIIQKAVEKLKQIDPSYFVGVRKIVVDSGSGYGHVQSGNGSDPAVIHINLSRIKSEIQAKATGASQQQLEEEMVRQVAIVIAHEKGHIKSFTPEQGFVGGENPAQASEHEMESKLK